MLMFEFCSDHSLSYQFAWYSFLSKYRLRNISVLQDRLKLKDQPIVYVALSLKGDRLHHCANEKHILISSNVTGIMKKR